MEGERWKVKGGNSCFGKVDSCGWTSLSRVSMGRGGQDIKNSVTMATDREVIVVAGVGELGRYICEELHASSGFEVVVLTRGVRSNHYHTTNLPSSPPQSSHRNPKSPIDLLTSNWHSSPPTPGSNPKASAPSPRITPPPPSSRS